MSERLPMKLPGLDPVFECNVSTLNQYTIHDVYYVNFDKTRWVMVLLVRSFWGRIYLWKIRPWRSNQ